MDNRRKNYVKIIQCTLSDQIFALFDAVQRYDKENIDQLSNDSDTKSFSG